MDDLTTQPQDRRHSVLTSSESSQNDLMLTLYNNGNSSSANRVRRSQSGHNVLCNINSNPSRPNSSMSHPRTYPLFHRPQAMSVNSIDRVPPIRPVARHPVRDDNNTMIIHHEHKTNSSLSSVYTTSAVAGEMPRDSASLRRNTYNNGRLSYTNDDLIPIPPPPPTFPKIKDVSLLNGDPIPISIERNANNAGNTGNNGNTGSTGNTTTIDESKMGEPAPKRESRLSTVSVSRDSRHSHSVVINMNSGKVTEIIPEQSFITKYCSNFSDCISNCCCRMKSNHSLFDCLSNIYNLLVVLLTITDITTDIVLLMELYASNQMTYFWIIIAILSITQIGYIIIFFISFDADAYINNIGEWVDKFGEDTTDLLPDIDLLKYLFIFFILFPLGLIGFLFFLCLLLPFGHFVPLMMYIAPNESSRFSNWLEWTVDIERRRGTKMTQSDELRCYEMTKFNYSKINKLGGFIVQSFTESLPMCILQFVFILNFKNNNNSYGDHHGNSTNLSQIAMVSFIVSMLSVITKSLVYSQALNWKSYFWCWLCVVTDFVGIFFVASWLCLNNDDEQIPGQFLGHFNVIASIWCIKFMVTLGVALSPFVFVFLFYVLFGQFVIMYATIWDKCSSYPASATPSVAAKVFMTLMFIIFGNAFFGVIYVLMIAFVVITVSLMEIPCFSILGGNLLHFTTLKRWENTGQKTADLLKVITDFVGNAVPEKGGNDRILRLYAVNQVYAQNQNLWLPVVENKIKEYVAGGQQQVCLVPI